MGTQNCSFDSLSTTQFSHKLRPAAERIYQTCFAGCVVKRLERQDGEAHLLDSAFAVDALLMLPDGSFLTLQEKYRTNDMLVKWGKDFTQEFRNAVGTENESNGEWFKLAAQLYFVGWANVEETGFESWALLSVLAYKMRVLAVGGLDKLAKLRQNQKHGRASFYPIPLESLTPAILADSDGTWRFPWPKTA